jgi:SMI1/KNR4 family protein SUKH-1
MSHRIKNYFSQFADDMPQENYHSIIALHENPSYDWETLQKQVPSLCRGWYELSKLQRKDRIEFLSDFWLSKFPYRQGVSEFLGNFLENVDDIGVFITQKVFEGPYEAHMVYCLKDDNGFYTGLSPATDSHIQALQKQFSELTLPADFIAFLRIHNGFCKTTDCTGIIPSDKIIEHYHTFQEMLKNNEIIKTLANTDVDPSTLIPFYKSFGMPFYQCFWTEWYPEEEMGNVYYSGQSKTIMINENEGPSEDNMAFPSFLDWLKFYLERIG